MVGGGGCRLAGSRRRCARLAALGWRLRLAAVRSAVGQASLVILRERVVRFAQDEKRQR